MCTPSCIRSKDQSCVGMICVPIVVCSTNQVVRCLYPHLVVWFLGPVSLINWANCLLLIISATKQKSFAVFSKKKGAGRVL